MKREVVFLCKRAEGKRSEGSWRQLYTEYWRRSGGFCMDVEGYGKGLLERYRVEWGAESGRGRW